jgi:hypothetical protein
MYDCNPSELPYNPLRRQFLNVTDPNNDARKITYLIVAVKLPTGAIELITNTEQLQSKIEYYRNAYDDNFCLKTNTAIKIVGYMLV